jgi:hypothetical protein
MYAGSRTVFQQDIVGKNVAFSPLKMLSGNPDIFANPYL